MEEPIEMNPEIKITDSKINKLCKSIVLPDLKKSNDIYLDLLEVIISQQLSGKIAKIIFNRFLQLFESNYPKPDALIKIDISGLRSAGLSQAKAKYVKNLAEFALLHDLRTNTINSLTDNEIIELLTKVKGIGKWSAEMILIFSLQRPDVFPFDDLVIKKIMIEIYGINKKGKELIDEMIFIANKWKPNRSLASRYLWAYYGLKESDKKTGI